MEGISIKEIPVGTRVYFKLARERAEKNIAEINEKIKNLEALKTDAREVVTDNKNFYIKELNLDVSKYQEYIEDKYITGKFTSASKLAFDKFNSDNTNLNIFALFRYGSILKEINDLKKKIVVSEKILKLTYREYLDILENYYTEVHKQMILKGYGYLLPPGLGWLCINRIKNKSKKLKVNFEATRLNKERIIKEGKIPYDKRIAEKCKKEGKPYNGVPYVVYIRNDYFYEVCLCNPTYPEKNKARFETADRRHISLRGMSNNDILAKADGNIDYILNLPIDIRLKVNLATKIDKSLYLNFIRNEHQTTFAVKQIDRKD